MLAAAMQPAHVWWLVHRERTMPQQPQGYLETDKEQIMKKLTLGALAVITSMAATSAALAQDVAAGKTSFNKCMACHAVGEGAKNKVGPELNGIDGRKSGTAEGYSYSDANKNSGIKNEKEANDLWAFLAQYDKDGKTK